MKTYETWQVVKALTEHWNWSAASLLVDATVADSADVDQDGDIWFHSSGIVKSLPFCPNRSDWHLYDTDGNEVIDYE